MCALESSIRWKDGKLIDLPGEERPHVGISIGEKEKLSPEWEREKLELKAKVRFPIISRLSAIWVDFKRITLVSLWKFNSRPSLLMTKASSDTANLLPQAGLASEKLIGASRVSTS